MKIECPISLHGQTIEMTSVEFKKTISGVGRNELHPGRYVATLTHRQFLPQVKPIRPSEAFCSYTDAIRTRLGQVFVASDAVHWLSFWTGDFDGLSQGERLEACRNNQLTSDGLQCFGPTSHGRGGTWPRPSQKSQAISR